MTIERSSVVTVFGSGDPRRGEAEYESARAVGRKLAESGYAIANGGYGGTMAASAEGASSAGGVVIGVTCSIWKSRPNEWVTDEIRTADLAQRVATLVDLGRCGYVCLPGSTGTLVELATVWEMTFKGLLRRRPIVCVGEFWRPLIDLMVSARAKSGEFVSLVPGAGGLAEFFPSL